ncbi:Mss4-like protein [Clohesyomyces aquaticus]|uniref:Mss4-like protein n=1 Tax=Clohesyomyces aquaticus TaxID=1231657 RepID=A0A1Y1YF79_9PLEO|nr:Mss4-like protein [Clohesyomyces aquaticus]
MSDPSPSPPTRTLSATCHCKASTLSFTIPTSSLPLPTHFCHCSICRHTHGTLCTIHAPVPAPTVDLSTFTSYKSSPRVERWFCSTCGAHMLDQDVEKGQWCVAASLVDAEEEVWRFEKHIHVEETFDGGLSTWLPQIGGQQLGTWKTKPGRQDLEDKPMGDYTAPTPSHSDADARNNTNGKGKKLHAHCHCHGIEFFISPPDPGTSFINHTEGVMPKDKTKWHASSDVCNSCRLTSSSFLTSWLFPSVSAITLSDGLPYPQNHIFGTAKPYQSSPGVTRTFCGTCGAVVVFAIEKRYKGGEGVVDVAAGLVDEEVAGGVRAEEGLEWSAQVGYTEDCGWREAVKGVQEGIGRWVERLRKDEVLSKQANL